MRMEKIILADLNHYEGVITKGIGGFYYVKTADGILECKARGRFRKEKILPYVGDRVVVHAVNETEGSIDEILPRKNQLIRPPVANIERLVLVMAITAPEPDLKIVDKLLVTAESKEIETAICINKTDLDSGEKTRGFREIYEKAGYPVMEVSAENETGLDEVCRFLQGKISAFAGNSGVGKSSILSLVTNRRLETGVISDRTERGKHTTRHVELLELPFGGFVLDTPGFSNIEVSGLTADDVRFLFPEIEKLEGKCRFRGCRHVAEPGCAVTEQVKTGLIASSRYQNYKDLAVQLASVKEWQKK